MFSNGGAGLHRIFLEFSRCSLQKKYFLKKSDHPAHAIDFVTLWLAVECGVAVTAHDFKVVGVQCDRWIVNVLRCDVDDMVHCVRWCVQSMPHAFLTESMLLFEVSLSASLPCFRFVECLCKVSHSCLILRATRTRLVLLISRYCPAVCARGESRTQKSTTPVTV